MVIGCSNAYAQHKIWFMLSKDCIFLRITTREDSGNVIRNWMSDRGEIIIYTDGGGEIRRGPLRKFLNKIGLRECPVEKHSSFTGTEIVALGEGIN